MAGATGIPEYAECREALCGCQHELAIRVVTDREGYLPTTGFLISVPECRQGVLLNPGDHSTSRPAAAILAEVKRRPTLRASRRRCQSAVPRCQRWRDCEDVAVVPGQLPAARP